MRDTLVLPFSGRRTLCSTFTLTGWFSLPFPSMFDTITTTVSCNALPLDFSGSCCHLWKHIWLHFFWPILCQRTLEISWNLFSDFTIAGGTWHSATIVHIHLKAGWHIGSQNLDTGCFLYQLPKQEPRTAYSVDIPWDLSGNTTLEAWDTAI